MKRLIVSAALLLVIGSISALTLFVQTAYAADLLDRLDRMDKAFQAKDTQTCQRLSDQFPDAVEEKVPTLSLFLQHKDLKEIQELSMVLPVILRQGDDDHFAAELARCRSLLKRLKELEFPTLENIL